MRGVYLLGVLFLLAGPFGHVQAGEDTGAGALDHATAVRSDSQPPKSSKSSKSSKPPKSGPDRDVAKVMTSDIKIGSGKPARYRDVVVAAYTMWRYDPDAADKKGRLLQSSKEVGRALRLVLRGGKIPRWLGAAVIGIKEGGVRRVIIPHDLATARFGKHNEKLPPGTAMVMEIQATRIQDH